MNKILSIVVVLQIIFAFSLSAQISEQLISVVHDVYELAQAGYKNEDPKKLLDAADILMDHTQIRSLGTKARPFPEAPDYFNIKALLESARQFTPINKKRKRRKIQKQIDNFKHSKMTITKGVVFVEPIKKLAAGEAVNIPQSYGAQKTVQLFLEDSDQLSLSLFHDQESDALASEAKVSPISLNYETKTSGNYKIEIKNMSYQQTLGTILMIMY